MARVTKCLATWCGFYNNTEINGIVFRNVAARKGNSQLVICLKVPSEATGRYNRYLASPWLHTGTYMYMYMLCASLRRMS